MNNKFRLKPLVAALLGAGLSQTAFAGETIDLGKGVNLDWQATATYTLSTRLENPDSELEDFTSGNDGNNNFDRGDLTANRLSLLLETRLYKGNSGLVASASTFYDDVYHNSTDNDGPVNYPGDPDEFTDGAERYHGGYSRLLDFYGYTTQTFGDDVLANFRLGKHVVSWGEALFFPGISGAQGPADGTKSDIPGTEVKDILLPEDQVSMQMQIGNDWSLLAHAQYGWHRTIVPEPGAFLSTSDVIGRGGKCLGPVVGGTCTFAPRGSNDEPDDFGQWGVGARYRLSLNTEVGLYYLNYHDRIPLTEVNPLANGGLGSYNVNYFDNIDLIGATFTTAMGKASIAGEVSYKDGAPTLVSTEILGANGNYNTIASATEAKILQTNLNTLYNFGRTPFADGVLLAAELAYVNVLDADKRRLAGADNLPETVAPETDDLYFSNHGLAFSTTLTLDYPGFTEDWDLSVPVSYSQQLSGRTLTGGVGGEGDMRGSVSANFTHRTGFQAGLTYVGFYGGSETDTPEEQRLLTDRDFVALVLKKAF
ncbi:DUF1302 domain-containing protein [Halomonas sp. PR-M31]|uniref:DUF1302 domain-containing protein n=1 Tax=Halomonas sp. PR-M31 TaxID=1471202 RepID=UPI0006524219|nr:DUF1302 family protein [Halomonas sp. PR-M31]